MKDEAGRDNRNHNEPYQEKAEDMKLWGVFLFGLIGATATTFAVSHPYFLSE